MTTTIKYFEICTFIIRYVQYFQRSLHIQRVKYVKNIPKISILEKEDTCYIQKYLESLRIYRVMYANFTLAQKNKYSGKRRHFEYIQYFKIYK